MTWPSFRHRRRASAGNPGELLVLAREQPALFADFYEAMYEQTLAFFVRRTFDPETAFDLTAECFAQAFDGLPRFRGQTPEEAHGWFWTIARRVLARWYDRGRVEREAIERIGLEPQPLTAVEFERAEELADLSAHREAIAEALASLPEDQQMAVKLRVIDEVSYAALAARSGVSEQVVRARVSRGLRRLARDLGLDDRDA